MPNNFLIAYVPIKGHKDPDFRELVYVAQNPTEFIQQVDRALSQPDPERPQRQYAVVKQHSWSARVKEISELLEKHLGVSLT